MKKYISILIIFCFFISCKPRDHWGKWVVNDHIPLDNYWRKVTGFDSLQITVNYEGDKLHYNFCFPNEWNVSWHFLDTMWIENPTYFDSIPNKKRITKIK